MPPTPELGTSTLHPLPNPPKPPQSPNPLGPHKSPQPPSDPALAPHYPALLHPPGWTHPQAAPGPAPRWLLISPSAIVTGLPLPLSAKLIRRWRGRIM